MRLAPYKTNLLSPFWLGWWSILVSISWILPNHYHPWLAFHMDAWMAMSLLLAAFAVIWRAKKPLPWHGITLLMAALVCVPMAQLGLGLIHVAGVAWVPAAYLAGFCLALLVGTQWENNAPNQLVDGLFLAIGIGSIVSVGLQLQQWLVLDGIELWKMGGGPERPYANFGQPNQLGTFLLWGLLATAWGWVQRKISAPVAVLMAAYLLFGLALTASRTAWIGLALLVIAGWVWRNVWHNKRMPWVASGLALYFAVCIAVQPFLRNLLLGDGTLPPDVLNAMSGHQRFQAWAAFAEAIAQRPWFGWGWTQNVAAQMAVAVDHPSLGGVFTSTHNLFLDLLVWNGLPLGLLISAALLMWAWRMVTSTKRAEDVLLVLFLAVVGNHAMLELPLHYAYFLLPTGLVMGVLNARLGGSPWFAMPRWSAMLLWLAVSCLLVLIVRDYTRVEPSHENFRMERMRIRVAHIDSPDTLLLTQWHEFIDVARTEPHANMSPEEIDKIRQVTLLFAGPMLSHKLATALALNQQPEEAKLWLQRICKSSPVSDCISAQNLWQHQSLKLPDIAAIAWPGDATTPSATTSP